MADKTVQVTLRANVQAYLAAMKQASSATGSVSKEGQASLSKLGGTLTSVGKAATLGVSVPLVGLGAVATKMAGNFDAAFTRMQSLAGVTAGEVDGMKESVLDLAGETGRAPAELADALYFLRSSGLDGAQAMDALDMSAKASAAGLGNTATIADAVSSAMNAYATSGLEAAEATDVLVATARAGKAEPEQLAAALGRVLPISSELGVAFEDVGAAIASLSLSGNDAAASSTLLTNILSKMLKPSQQGAAALAAVGMSTDSIRASIAERGLLETLEDLRARLGDAGFVKFLEDAQAVQGGLALTGQNIDDIRRIFDEVRGSAGAAEDAFASWADSMDADATRAFAEFQTALIRAGEIILPIATGIVGGLADITEAFSDAPRPVQLLVLSFLGLTALVGPMAIFTGAVIRNLTTIGVGLDVVRTKAIAAQVAIAGPGGLIAALLALEGVGGATGELGVSEGADLARRERDALIEGTAKLVTVTDELTVATGESMAAIAGFTPALEAAGGAMDFFTGALGGADGALPSFTMRMSDIYDLSLQGASGLEQLGSAAGATAAEMREMRSAAIAALSPLFDHEQLGLQLAEGLMSLEDAVADYNEGLADGTLKGKDQARALIDIRQQQIANTETTLAMATAYADQSGAADGSRKHTRLMRDELVRLASENPAIRAEVQRYIDKLNGILAKKRTDVGLDGKKKAEDDAADVKGAIDDIPGSKRPKVTLDGSQVYGSADAIERRLNEIPDEDVTVRLHYDIAGGPHPPTMGAGAPTMMGGTTSMMGEGGPELVVFHDQPPAEPADEDLDAEELLPCPC